MDEPRRTVEDADKLVAAVMQRLAKGFADERSSLEKQWDRGDSVSTEDLRIALQRYRSLFRQTTETIGTSSDCRVTSSSSRLNPHGIARPPVTLLFGVLFQRT